MLRNALVRRLILTLALTGPAGCAESTVDAGEVVTAAATVDPYNIFYTALSPYGAWFWIDGFGDVWQPSISSSAGWVFAAERDHGRWGLGPEGGWVWVPGHRSSTANMVRS